MRVQMLEFVVLLLLLFVALFAAVARRLQTPYPIALVIAGLLLGFIPGIPRINLDPDIVFFVLLPPLLYAAAWTTSWRDFSYNLISISFLAVGLVAFTVLAIGAVAHAWFPAFDARLGIVLGALVAPTDAVAATTIARRLGLPRRIVDVLEGESLVNDATGLLALEFGMAMVMHGETPGAGAAILRLSWLAAGGIGVGLVIGRIVEWIELHIDDAPIEFTISILVPYAAYFAGESVRASGILAVVATGLYLSRRSSRFFSPRVRIQLFSVWNALVFVLNGVAFVLIGLQLPYVVAGIRGRYGWGPLLWSAAIFSAIVILLRLLWVFPGAHLAYFLRRRLLGQKEPTPPPRHIFVVGWTGMRGVVALAAALALPRVLANGSPFPHRDLIIFLTFGVILVTLVAQGLSLPALIRALGLAGNQGRSCEEREARQIVAEAALAHLADARQKDDAAFRGVYDDLEQHYRGRLDSLSPRDGQDGTGTPQYRYDELTHELLRVERETALRLRDEGRISDEVLRQLERDIDLGETRLSGLFEESN
ncbi:MAG TPA: Na+/H+ antiporter [Myxococcales bacterium]|nr:Na+/H+ antiporter [Myxococcales bacterium]